MPNQTTSTGQKLIIAGTTGVTIFSLLAFYCTFSNNNAPYLEDKQTWNIAELAGGLTLATGMLVILGKLTQKNLNQAVIQLRSGETALSISKDWKNTTPTAFVFALFEGCLAVAGNGAAGLKTLSMMSQQNNLIGWVASATLAVISAAALVYGFDLRAHEKFEAPNADRNSDSDLRGFAEQNPLRDGPESKVDYTQGSLTTQSGPGLASSQQRQTSRGGSSNGDPVGFDRTLSYTGGV